MDSKESEIAKFLNEPPKNGSLLIRAANNPNTQENVANVWAYAPSIKILDGTTDMLQKLTELGWREVPSPYQSPLYTQLHAAVHVQNLKDKTFTIWAHKDSAAYVEEYPVSLICELDLDLSKEITKRISITTTNIMALPMLTPLPFPSAGEGGFILNYQNLDGMLIGHRITDLPQEAQQRHAQISALLHEMAEPARWIPRLPVHEIVSDVTELQHELEKWKAHIQLGTDKAVEEARLNITNLKMGFEEINQVIELVDNPSYEKNFEELQKLMQKLGKDYFEYYQSTQSTPPTPPTEKLRLIPLPDLRTTHQTTVPSTNHVRGLVQSFGPRITKSYWNIKESTKQHLEAPNGAILTVKGENGHEQKALHQFVEGGMGVEGIKYMVALLAAYDEQTGSIDRKIDARITLRQLLQFMGKGDHADDLDEQRKLMNYILYLARTWITAKGSEPQPVKKRGRPRTAYLEYTPLVVLEALGSDERGGVRIPETVEFHLGKEYWDQMFGRKHHYFSLPTGLILGYSSRNQPQEICLAFYLANMINLNFGSYDVRFTKLLMETGMQDQEDIKESANRTRNALRVLYAIERLTIDHIISREHHENIETALTADFLLKPQLKARFKLKWEDLSAQEQKKTELSEATYKRMQQQYTHFTDLSETVLMAKRRTALQSLLDREKDNSIKFKSGTLINQQIEKREEGRALAIKKREAAQEAARKRVKGRRQKNNG